MFRLFIISLFSTSNVFGSEFAFTLPLVDGDVSVVSLDSFIFIAMAAVAFVAALFCSNVSFWCSKFKFFSAFFFCLSWNIRNAIKSRWKKNKTIINFKYTVIFNGGIFPPYCKPVLISWTTDFWAQTESFKCSLTAIDRNSR